MADSVDHKENNALKNLSVKMAQKTIGRVMSFVSVRILTIFLAIGVGLYIILMVINLGGYVDEIMYGQISETIGGMAFSGAFNGMDEQARDQRVEELRTQMAESMGLNQPLPIRTARWWFNGMTMRWGTAERLQTLDRQSNLVKDVIFDRLPYTLLLVGVANVVLFFINLRTALVLSSQRGKFWDRLLSSLTPISSAPSWILGILLVAIFAIELGILPIKGMFDGAPPGNTLQYVLQIMKHMILPVMAIILSVFFQGVYSWRTFFMVHSGEDYVDLAKAKGLPEPVFRRRYLLLPTLPSIVTSFTLMLISFWEGAIALEVLFDWPGFGALFLEGIQRFDRPVVVAIVVMFAYLMGISVILLDIVYAIIDPRVRVGRNGASARMRGVKKYGWKESIKKLFTRKTYQSHQTPPTRLKKKQPDTNISTSNRLKKSTSSGYLETLFHQSRRQIFKYPMAVVGLIIILILFIVSIFTVISLPYDEAVAYWHSEGKLFTPRLARPTWTNFFRREKWPESIYFDSRKDTKDVDRRREEIFINEEMMDIQMFFEFEYTADVFPQDLVVYFISSYEEKAPFVSLIMKTPDEREIDIKNFKATDGLGFALSHENIGRRQFKDISSIQQVFGDPSEDYLKPMKGDYEFQVLAIVFEPEAAIDVEGDLRGKVYGLFGTDTRRRDLTIAMMWGTPVALTFGIIGAILTTTTTILLAAVGAWFGGILDEIIQRIAEINFTLPALPIVILVYILYSKSIWAILGVMVLLNIFGSSLKEYRAMFLQFKESPYIEAAIAYGAPNRRIIFKYLLPRIIQVMVPQLVIAVPSYVFLEATLAYLGVAAPYLPTWGKVINMALNEGVLWAGHYFWVLQPVALVMITGLAFAFVGFALDKIFNPRLRNL